MLQQQYFKKTSTCKLALRHLKVKDAEYDQQSHQKVKDAEYDQQSHQKAKIIASLSACKILAQFINSFLRYGDIQSLKRSLPFLPTPTQKLLK